MNIPTELLRNPHFSRYYRTWQKNPLSIVFIPLAQICREQGLFEEAKEICEQGLARHPDSVSGRLMLAWIYFDMDQVAESRRMVEGILTEFPIQQEAKILLERIVRTTEPSHENDHTTKPQLQPISLWENVTMAKIYADQGEAKIAQRILDRLLTHDPNDVRARRLKEELQCKS